MKRGLTFLMLVMSLSLFAQNDTTYLYKLGVYKSEANIASALMDQYQKIGVSQEIGVQGIFVVDGTVEFQKEKIPVKEYYFGTFSSLDSIKSYLKSNKVFSDYFSDGTIVRSFIDTTSKRVYLAVKEVSIDAFIKPLVDGIATGLFFDPFTSTGISEAVVMDNKNEPIITKKGGVKETHTPLIVIWLVVGAIFFTIFFKFINIRGFRHAIGIVQGKHDDHETKGEVSHFQALATALSATVGLGNIAGVAIAISLGGPGATFWMIVAGLLGMSLKFAECTLGVKYREIDENGEVSGGPMYYLSKGLKKKGLGRFGKFLAALFAILCVGGSLGGGNMFQANQAYAQLSSQVTFINGNGVMFGLVLAVLVGVVIIGGIKSIARVTEKIVPFMAVLYVGIALIIIFANYSKIGEALSMIIDGAFNATALKGGFVGVLILGFKRAAFSNEAGVGSASIAHSAVKTDKPISEGFVSLLEPFIDTVVICTMTAVVIVITGHSENPFGLEGAPLTSAAFGSVFSWFPVLLVIAILLFAFSTMVSWSYYGLKAWTYLLGKSKSSELTYKIIFLVFIVIGSSVKLGAVLDFSDMMILAMAFPNILGLYILAPELKQDLKEYEASLKKK